LAVFSGRNRRISYGRRVLSLGRTLRAPFIPPHGLKAEALKSLRQYVAKRVNMTDYPSYRQAGYD